MNEIKPTETFSLAPTSLAQAMEYSEMIARTDMVPKDYKGKPANILVAIQMGQEVGLAPMQALQNIAVINGRPSLWGDAMIALIMSHPKFISIDESLDESTMIATCVIKRLTITGEESVFTSTFSKDDATKAGLWTKQGPWKQYPKRMLQLRARGFCCRDSFADALKGLHSAEESRDMAPEKDITPKKSALAGIVKQAEPIKEIDNFVEESLEVDAEILAEEQRGIDLENVIGALDGAKDVAVYEVARDAAIEHAEAFPEDQLAVREAILRCKTKLKEG